MDENKYLLSTPGVYTMLTGTAFVPEPCHLNLQGKNPESALGYFNEWIEQNDATTHSIVVDREDGTITFKANHHTTGEPNLNIIVDVSPVKEILDLGINDPKKTYTTQDLRKLLLYKAYLFDRQSLEAARKALSTFALKVQTFYDDHNDLRGNIRQLFEQKVDSQDLSITLYTRIFPSLPAYSVRLDIVPEPADKSVLFSLVSEQYEQCIHQGLEIIFEAFLLQARPFTQSIIEL